MPDQQVPLPKEPFAPDRPAQTAGQPVVLQRLASVDAFRGLVLFLMIAEILLRLHAVGKALPQSRFWQILRYHQLHVDWEGTSLQDLIHPSFTFLSGDVRTAVATALAAADGCDVLVLGASGVRPWA